VHGKQQHCNDNDADAGAMPSNDDDDDDGGGILALAER